MKRLVRLALLGLLATGCRDTAPPVGPGPGTEPTAALLPGLDSGMVFVGAGDIASCTSTGDEATAALLDDIPGAVFTAGDNVYPNGTASDFATCYDPSWGRHKSRTRPAAGNHDYNTPGAAGQFAYFGAAAGDSGKYYYSYDLGQWHVVVLNSNIDMSLTSPQFQWLESDLAASRAPCTLAIWHHPRFSSGINHSATERYLPAWQALYDAGAEIVINGHEHQYERFSPQTPAGDADALHGIRQFIVGTGGEEVDYPFGPPLPNSEMRDNQTFGVLNLTLNSTGYAWQFIPVAGQTFTDAGAGHCHGAPPNRPPVSSAGGPYTTTDGTVHFDGSSSFDPDGSLDYPLTYRWDFGDGNVNDAGPRPSHTYLTDGVYAVRLTVADFRGQQGMPTVTFVRVTRNTRDVLFSGAGNIAKCTNDNDEATAQLLDALPGFVFALGDNAFPNGAAADYANCYRATWGRHKTRTYPLLGNHDYDAGNADGAFGYFGSRVGPAGKGYYSVTVGDWHVVVLNDNGAYVPYAAGSEQEQWLKADLAANPAVCTLAMWHVPLFLSSDEAGYTVNPSRKVLWNDLYAAGADVVLNGHQHHYERMAPMLPDGTRDDATGIRQFNVGTGGESLGLPTVAIHPNSEARLAVYGVLQLTLRAGSYDWRFSPIAGEPATDSGSGTCH